MSQNWHDDYEPLPPSERNQASVLLAEGIKSLGLAASPQDGQSVRDESGKFYSIRFSLKSILDGEARVYGQSYVMVFWKTLIPGLPGLDRRIFSSVEETLVFLDLAFREKNWPAALRVPIYQYVRGPRRKPEVHSTIPEEVDADFFMADRVEDE